MKTRTLIATLFFLPCFFFIVPVTRAQLSGPEFISWESAQEAAHEADKPFLVFFYDRDCPTCTEAFWNTWEAEKTKNLVNQNFLSFDATLQDDRGMILAKKFDVRLLPSVLFFNSNGEVIDRKEGEVSAMEMAGLLEGHLHNLNHTLPVVYFGEENTKEDEPTKGETMSGDSRGERAVPQVIIERVPGYDQYGLNRITAEPAFGILIGRYDTMERLAREVARFERVWRRDLWVYSEKQADFKMYILVLGTYESDEQAQIYAEVIHRLAKRNTEIVHLDRLKS